MAEVDDLEDGEILDSDEELSAIEQSKVTSVQKDFQSSIVSTVGTGRNLSCDIHNYRQNKANGAGYNSSSDNSDDSEDEDIGLWKKKRVRYCEKQSQRHSDMQVAESLSETPFSEENTFVNPNRLPQSKKDRKINNIWGSVMEEQILTKDLKGVGVEKSEAIILNERDVETYDYMKAREDTRPDNPDDKDEEDVEGTFSGGFDPEDDLRVRKNLKRKKPAKSRIGKRTFDANKDRTHLKATEDDCEAIVVSCLCTALDEPKTELMTRVVNAIGKKKALELLYMTEDVESAGGMMTVNGERRRTAGGVYLQLLKSDDRVTKDQINDIFAEENKAWKEKLRERRQQKRKGSKKKYKSQRKDKEMECEGQSDDSDNDAVNPGERSPASDENEAEDLVEKSLDIANVETNDIIIE